MKLETFFEKFDQFADVPGAVAKMRELVLQLAVTGRLVPQDDLNESAELLLERAAEEALKLPIATKYQRLTKDAEEHLASRELQSLPRGWVWTCSAVIGETAPRVDADDDALVAFAPMHLLPTDYRSTFTPEVRPWREIKKGYTHFADGDVGFAKITPCFQNGKGCVFANLPGGIGSGTTELHILRPFSNVVLPLYALLYYKSPEFVAGGVASFSGTAGQQRVSNDYFRFAPFPLPPLAEQKRIVAKVDELMALCDRLEAQQQAREEQSSQLARASLARFATAPTPANLNYLFHPSYNISPADLRKSILTLAVQGKLVPQDPNDEPAEELLKRISIIREHLAPRKRAHAVKRVRELEGSNCTQDVPSSWTWCRLGELVLEFRYGTSRKCSHVENGIPVLRIPNIRNGRIDPADLKFTNMPPSEFNELQLREGDLLLVRSNGSETLVGRSAVVTSIDERFAYAGYLVRARLPKSDIFAPFIHVALSTQGVRNQIEGPIRTTSGVKNINTTELSNLTLPLPPVAEQRRIVARVSQLMTLVDELETHLTTTRTTAQNLLSALVTELTRK